MVAAISLLNVLGGAGPAGANDVPVADRVRIATELVAALLDDHAHIEAMDSYGPRNECRRFLTKATAAPFRKLHEDWLTQVEALLPRLKAIRDAGHAIPRFDELADAALVRRGLLGLTIEAIDAGLKEIGEGRYVTAAEVRRELRAQAGR